MASFDAAAPLGDFGRPDQPMRSIAVEVVGRLGSILSRAALIGLFMAFAFGNYSHWRRTGSPSGLGTTFLEAWVASMFLVRRAPDRISRRLVAWIAAPIGSFSMLLARPATGGLPHVACELVQLLGVLIALASLGTLGRSFGIVAANRGLKTGGPYRAVRHPAYAGYLMAYLGYVAENPSVVNVGLLLLSTGFQLIRMSEEESVLAGEPSYRSYREAVRYRLIPLVY